MCSRKDPEYYTMDIISDILSRGNSSRLYKELVKKKRLFSEINAYVTGDFDKGLFVVSGKLVSGVSIADAEIGIEEELNKLRDELVGETELTKVKNKIESTLMFSEMEVLNKAMNLAISELLGDADLINREVELYSAVTAANVKEQSSIVFNPDNCSTLYYLRENKKGV